MLHTIIAYVEDKPGVLNRVASLFRRRAFNIESLAVGVTEVPGLSRITVVVDVEGHEPKVLRLAHRRKQQVADNATALAASDKATHATQHPTAMEEGMDFE